MDAEIDTDYKDFIICPYCGEKHEDSWEIAMNDSEGEYECLNCGKKFKWEVHTITDYSTSKIEDE
jgi:DNA-directed RNA polymerase subunit RPC12/RpoP